jgi:hypothetical protein
LIFHLFFILLFPYVSRNFPCVLDMPRPTQNGHVVTMAKSEFSYSMDCPYGSSQ